jgi:hypothetical protein
MALHVARRMIRASSSTGGEIFFSVFMASLGITFFTLWRDLFRRTNFLEGYNICKEHQWKQ